MTEQETLEMRGGMLRVMSRYRPSRVKEYLDRHVVGQEEAKRTLSVAVYNHMKRSLLRAAGGTSPARKSNVILLGGTGCGKTLLARRIADYMKVPCHICDCTKFTASGYIGLDAENCIAGLLRACNYDVEKARHGIVVLDEIDKNAARYAGTSATRDVNGECVQQSLLRIVEGDLMNVPAPGGRKLSQQQAIQVDTSDILFIATGAFTGIDEIVARRTRGGRIGFGKAGGAAGTDGQTDRVTPQDLRDFGLIPEFVGRFPVIARLDDLGREDLVRILTEPEESLVREYRELLEMDGVELTFETEALDAVAERALGLGTGARGLRGVMEDIMRDVMFDAPDLEGGKRSITVTRGMVGDSLRQDRRR